ncbi:MAG: DUF418 domain-containing protein [Sandaracinaceae bacterium]
MSSAAAGGAEPPSDGGDRATIGRSAVRLTGYDVARSFAILGMILINFQVFLLNWNDGAPAILHALAQLPSGRASSLFVTLAGVGVTLMARGAERWAVQRTLLLRSLVLLVAGNLLILVWYIDILHFYAFYLAIAAMVLVYLPRRALPLLAVVITFAAPVLRLAFPDVHAPRGDAYRTPLGMFEDVVGWGIHPILPWLAFLCIGMYVGGLDLYDVGTRRRLLMQGSLLAVLALLASYLVEAMIDQPALMRFAGTEWSPSPLYVIGAIGSALFQIALANEIAVRWPRSTSVRALVATGQLSLSIYIFHALVGVGVPRWALHLEDQMALGPVVVWWVAFSLISVTGAVLYRQRFAKGPLEWVLRKVSGRTPPRVAFVPLQRMPAVPAWPWAFVVVGVACVAALYTVGLDGRYPCGEATPLGVSTHGEVTVGCQSNAYTFELDEPMLVILATHSDHDLMIELHDGLVMEGGETLIAEDDDSGVGLDARLARRLEPGMYRVVVHPFSATVGGFLLTREHRVPEEDRPGCSNTCESAYDGECDDGAEGSLYDVCERGTDCADCGAR